MLPSAAPEKLTLAFRAKRFEADTSHPPLALNISSSVFPFNSTSHPPLASTLHDRAAIPSSSTSQPPLAFTLIDPTEPKRTSASHPPEKLPLKSEQYSVKSSRSVPPLNTTSKSPVRNGLLKSMSTPPDAVIFFRSVTVTYALRVTSSELKIENIRVRLLLEICNVPFLTSTITRSSSSSLTSMVTDCRSPCWIITSHPPEAVIAENDATLRSCFTIPRCAIALLIAAMARIMVNKVFVFIVLSVL